ncbi:N-acetyltransferase [Candidatus Hydrogenisulfobacillus filiaventi]|uniref:N-acetyltransferase n=1 Tax=Candidatus Hydrogenisulfobacillus filiaventi TaxID=2707344 RepID=A0A6F8ZJC7_9FIRM|nr:GNAT family N-acetyltransferase [Bacillota bacterium]CAB1129690.1 N-acetyltransferase [Candidatus Hydrogenisulfobacillus filiaventi]
MHLLRQLKAMEGPLRPLAREDMPQLVAWDNDPEIVALAGKKFHAGQAEAVRWWEQARRDRHLAAFAIADEAGRLLGDIMLKHISWRRREAELQVTIGDRSRWGQGYGTAAIRELLGLAFGPLSLRRVYLRVHASNQRALAVYARLGFRPVGRLLPGQRLPGPPLILMELRREAFRAG